MGMPAELEPASGSGIAVAVASAGRITIILTFALTTVAPSATRRQHVRGSMGPVRRQRVGHGMLRWPRVRAPEQLVRTVP